MNDPQTTEQPHVYIIVLNWNGWRDTIECLESIFKLDYPSFTVVVCDNNSSDESMENMENWARGNVVATGSSPDLLRLVEPPYPKPIQFVSVPASGGAKSPSAPDCRFVLIQTGANLGFAGGNNVGIRYALAHGHHGYVWLLNNDTVIEPSSLSALVQMAEGDPKLGICGSLLCDYAAPHAVQSIGRRYSCWTGRTRAFRQLNDAETGVADTRGYIVEGASMMISGRFLEKVGLLEESYFLFFEELDWMTRAAPAFSFGYSSASVVYHKTGASIGSAIARTSRSSLSDFYQARNRLVFTRRHHPWFTPFVLIAAFISALQRVMIRRPRNAGAIVRGALASFSPTRSKGQVIG